MKICHVLSSMSIGGMERMVQGLINAQAESDVEPYLFCTDSEGPLFDKTAAAGKLCAERKSSFLVIDFNVVRRLTDYIRENNIDLIHAHNHLGIIYGSLVSRKVRCAFTATLHGQGAGYSKKARLLERLLLNRAGCVIAVSDDARDVILKKRLAPESKVVVVKNGVDVRKANSQEQLVLRSLGEGGRGKREGNVSRGGAERAEKIDVKVSLNNTTTQQLNNFERPKPFVIGSVGRFAAEKNYPLLLRAFAKARERLTTRSPDLESRRRESNYEIHKIHENDLGNLDGCDATHPKYPNDLSDKERVLPTDNTDEADLEQNTSSVSADSRGSAKPLASTAAPPREIDLNLLLVGDGTERIKLEALVDELCIRDNVTFTGMQDNVMQWMKKMDVFCLSSDTEGTSITLLEAGAIGLPAVVTDVGGNAEIVADGTSGIVVPDGDEQDLSDAFLKLIKDPDLRKRLGDNARLRIQENYSIEQMAKQYQEIYKRILQ